VSASVNIVAEEEVVIGLDVAVLIWRPPEVEEPHQVLVLAVHIAEDFDWRVHSKNHGLLRKNIDAGIGQTDDSFASEIEKSVLLILQRPVSWSQQVVQEYVLAGFGSLVFPDLAVLFLLFNEVFHLLMCSGTLAWPVLDLNLLLSDLALMTSSLCDRWSSLSIRHG